ncbi:MAG: LOG family protein [Candidatus Omnitrophica bacterium]|nr:LOG family protein [Candidatus Omnitrophota bacterium]
MPWSASIITLFGSVRPQSGSSAWRQAYAVGQALAQRGCVVCNGGYGGTMEAAAKGAREAGGRTIGITVERYHQRANRYIDREIRMATLLGRLERLVRIADGFIIFPGGTGTLLELSLVLEYTHKHLLRPKPMVFLGACWRRTVEQARGEQSANAVRRYIHFARTPQEAVTRVLRYN